ncbi:MAG TPA: hypothetical protein VJ804_01970 [Acidimicrobiales bacterium]|nr:hypothetical protein [Acidimicrobiales bacterium]
MTVEPGVPGDRTLTEVLAGLSEEGFTEDVLVREDGQLCCARCGHCVAAEDMQLRALRRLEGASDPSDMAAVLGLECPACGMRGTAIVRFGPEAGPGEEIVLQHLDDQRLRHDGRSPG